MSIFKSSLWFSLGTVLSRVSGLIREAVIAGVFGASAYFDAFLVAFRIPNLLRDMMAEGSLSGAFTRVYTATYESEREQATILFWRSLRFFFTVALVVVCLGAATAPWLVDLMTLKDGYSPDSGFHQNAVYLTRVLFPYLLFPVLASLAMGVLHCHKKFFATGFAPVFLNLGFILGALVFAKSESLISKLPGVVDGVDTAVVGLALGVLLGGLCQFLFQFYFARKVLHKAAKKTAQNAGPLLKKVIILMAPAAIAASSGPLTGFVNTNFATHLGEGAVSWLYYAFRILQLPIGVFAVALGVAALPALTKSITKAGGRVDEVASRQLQKTFQIVLWMMVPAALMMFFAAQEIINLIFKHMAFNRGDAYATADALKCYAFGVVGYGVIKVMTSYYFAVERTRFAMVVSLCGVGATIAGNSLLIDQFGHLGLAAATSITLSLNACVLLAGTRLDKVSWDFGALGKTFGGLLFASLLFVGAHYALSGVFTYLNTPVDGIEEKVTAFLSIMLNVTLLTAAFTAAIYAVERKSPLKFFFSKT